MSGFQQIYEVSKSVLSERKYFAIFIIFSLLFFGLFIYIPVAAIPGNTPIFQLSVFRPRDYLLMTLLALLVSLNLSMNVYNLQTRKQKSAVSGAAASLSGTFAAIAGTATCTSCLATLFGFIGLGAGSVAFVLKYQILFLLGAIILVVASLYFTARKINRHCTACK